MVMDEIYELIINRNTKTARQELALCNPADVASFMEGLYYEREDEENRENDITVMFRLLSKDLAAEVFAYLEQEVCEMLIGKLSDEELSGVINNMFTDDAVDLVEEMPANVAVRILARANNETRERINKILGYPENSAGSIMTTEFVSLGGEFTVKDAFDKIKREGVNKETVYTLYVTEYKSRKLVGVVTVKEMIFADPDTKLKELMLTDVISVTTNDSREDVVKLFDKYDLLAIPVTDSENRIVGIVTVDDVIDVIREVTDEGFSKMSAVVPSETTYLRTGAFTHAKNRIIWLIVLMLTSTFTGAVIATYQESFSALPLLVSFIPMLMNTAGNCGSQSSGLVIRGLAVDEIRFKDIFRVIFKEFSIALIVSPILAIVNGVRIYIVYGDLLMAFVVSLSLIFAVMLAKIIGAVLPLVAKKVGLDPALMASPLITTIVDMCSVAVYFSLATRFLNI